MKAGRDWVSLEAFLADHDGHVVNTGPLYGMGPTISICETCCATGLHGKTCECPDCLVFRGPEHGLEKLFEKVSA